METPPPTREQLERDVARLEAEAARETEQRQQQGATAEEAEGQAPGTPGGAAEEGDEEDDEEDDEDEDDDDDVLESDDDDENTTEAEKLRRQANREADVKLAQRLLGDLREEVASLETDEWEHEKPRFG